MRYKVPLISSLLYFLSSLIYLYFNGFHEDAYILFNYSENLSNHGVISYYPDGPPAEGATDFLWMILLSFMYLIKIPTFLSVSILNSLGTFIISYVLVFFLRDKLNKKTLIILSTFWLVSLGVISSFSGFSTIFYNSVLMLSILSLYHKRKILPYLLLILSLIRPDGVVLSMGFLIITIFWRPFNTQFFKDYFLGYLLSAFLGIGYFLWRWNYFGEILPLPLLVKSNSSESILPGLGRNLRFIENNFYFLIVLFLVVLKSRKENVIKYLPIIVPGIMLFVSLLFAHQSQNFGFRFQFPLWISCFLYLVILIKENSKIVHRNYFSLILMILIFLQFTKFYKRISSSNQHYIDDFSINFLENFENSKKESITVALTEAGRFTYWTIPSKSIVLDLIGLNTKENSKEVLPESYLETVNPDLIFIHHSGIINKPIERISSKIIKVKEAKQISANTDKPRGREDKVPFVTLKYLEKKFNFYNFYLVDYTENGAFSHLFALKKSSDLDSIFIKSLTPSFNQRNTFFHNLKIRDKY